MIIGMNSVLASSIDAFTQAVTTSKQWIISPSKTLDVPIPESRSRIQTQFPGSVKTHGQRATSLCLCCLLLLLVLCRQTFWSRLILLKGNCHQNISLSYLVVPWLLITMVSSVFLCDGWKWVNTWKEGAQNCPEVHVPSDVTPDLTSTRTFVVKNEVQPVCWSIELTSCSDVWRTCAFWTLTHMGTSYRRRMPKRQRPTCS